MKIETLGGAYETKIQANSLKLFRNWKKETFSSKNTHTKTLMRQNDKSKPNFQEQDSVMSFILFHLISIACQEHSATFTGIAAF